MKLKTRLILIFALIFGLTLTTRFVFTWQSQRKIIAEKTADINRISEIVQFATAYLTQTENRDREALKRFISEVVTNHNALEEISIINIKNVIIASSNPENINKHFSDLKKEQLEEKHILKQKDILDSYNINIPITQGKKIVGYVLATIEISDADESFVGLYLKNAIVSLVLFTTVLLVLFYILTILNKPLAALVKASRRIASGNLNVKVEKAGTNEYAEVAQAFNNMTKKLSEQRDLEVRLREVERQAVLSEVLATMAHEVRNPLNLINLTAGHLARQFVPEDENKRADFIQFVDNLKEQVKHLNTMVTRFIDAGKPVALEKETFALSVLINQIKILVKQDLLEKGITIHSDLPSKMDCFGDIEQIRLVLLNLIINAIEFSPAEGTITITASINEDTCIFSISDNGPGISPGDIDNIFKPYFSQRSGGTGLGLALARRVVKEHGGSITAENVPGSGARFTITLPGKDY